MPDARLAPRFPALLLATSVAQAGLALYQWLDLIHVRNGGEAVCAINETVNCTKVWNSDFANRIHDVLGMPVAGLGMTWALSAIILSAWLLVTVRQGASSENLVAAVKLWGLAAFFSTITFAVASFSIGAVCLTCLGTYALSLTFAGLASFGLPGGAIPGGAEAWGGGARAGVVFGPVFLLLLYPGLHTPHAAPAAAPKAVAATDDQVVAYFQALTPPEKQITADARKKWLTSQSPDVSAFAVRALEGSADAPVKIVEFTDMLCGHCRTLVQVLSQLEKVVPPGSLSIESRHFPLDGECNPAIKQARGDGVRCTAAKALICLEQSKDFRALREKLFEEQSTLTKEKVLAIASSGSLSRADLESCIGAVSTDAKLKEDLNYAALYEPDGTPLVLLNGRETMPAPPFLYGMVMSKADAQARWFDALPPAR
jgi:serine/threonine-protein kinase